MTDATSTRSSAALSKASSHESLKSNTSSRKTHYSHPLYLNLSQTKDTVHIVEESSFSSCSTSPNSSFESLHAFPFPQFDESRLSAAPSALSAALSTCSSTRSSRSASQSGSRFADDHYPLITNVATTSKNVHASILDMAHAYNVYIRAINSCYNHALTIDEDSISDFLFFNQTLFNILSQHLKAEQRFLQPFLHQPLLNPYSTKNAASIHEDHMFRAFFHIWANYIHDPATQRIFSGVELQASISRFAPLLVQHLHDSVSHLNTLVSAGILLPEHLSNVWSKFEDSMSASLDLYTDAALMVGCHDKHFKINGQRGDQKFPRLPMGTTTMVKKWHSRKFEGAWRFCSSDFGGNRRTVVL